MYDIDSYQNSYVASYLGYLWMELFTEYNSREGSQRCKVWTRGKCHDTDFLKNTLLKRYLKFVKGSDPLLIRISRKRK